MQYDIICVANLFEIQVLTKMTRLLIASVLALSLSPIASANVAHQASPVHDPALRDQTNAPSDTTSAEQGQVTASPVTIISVVFDNVRRREGNVVLRLCTQSQYEAGGAGCRAEGADATRDPVTTAFNNVAPGRYMIDAYHDLNANNQLDFRFFGPPKEPVGASNNARGRFSPPKFEDAAFDVSASDTMITVNISLYGG